jgi:protein tyrosine/serine phosphatase
LARRLASREAYLELLDLFASAEKPLLIHCKSGADRSGLAAAFYLIDREGVPAKEAKKQLALKYAHFRWTRAGILDHLLEAYEAADSANPIALREWLTTRYDPAELTSSFTRSRWWWRA